MVQDQHLKVDTHNCGWDSEKVGGTAFTNRLTSFTFQLVLGDVC